MDMAALVDAVGSLNLVAYVAVAVAAVRLWREQRGSAGLWAAVAFGSLGFIVLANRLVPERPETLLEHAAQRLIVAVLLVFPYLLFRFTTAFDRPSRRLERLVSGLSVVLVLWTFLLPHFPSQGEPRSLGFDLYLAAFLLHWSILSIVVAWRLIRAARRQPTVARTRMRLLGFAATALTVAILFTAFQGDDDTPAALASALLALVSAVAFYLGLAPPAVLRMVWRRQEQAGLQNATAELMGATSERDVAERVLPPMAGMVGASAVALVAPDGHVIGSYGLAPDEVEERRPQATVVDAPFGDLLLWTSSYAPFFGAEELRLLRALGGLTGLALDRARLFAQERDARVALEQADDLKTSFIALAAHELRNPVAAVHGIAQTLHSLHERLSEQQRLDLERSLAEQTTRLGSLVDQLLDLSRLDADAIHIEPERLSLRRHVQDLVASVAGERSGEVQLRIPEELEATIDPNALDRVVGNLVANALRYGAQPVTVSAEQRDRHLRVVVADEGGGVPTEFVPSLFDRFTRSSASRAHVSGTGLGLAIARSYARAHGGDLLYHAGERGAEFELVLPHTGN
jgi:signal transduction histidine kinase